MVRPHSGDERGLLDSQRFASLSTAQSSLFNIPRTQSKEQVGQKRNAGVSCLDSLPSKRRATDVLSATPNMALRDCLLQALDLNSTLSIHETTQLAITLVWLVHQRHGDINEEVRAGNVNIVLVQDEQKGVMSWAGRAGLVPYKRFNLQLVIGRKVVVKGESTETRRQVLDGFRNAVEKMASEVTDGP